MFDSNLFNINHCVICKSYLKVRYYGINLAFKFCDSKEDHNFIITSSYCEILHNKDKLYFYKNKTDYIKYNQGGIPTVIYLDKAFKLPQSIDQFLSIVDKINTLNILS